MEPLPAQNEPFFLISVGVKGLESLTTKGFDSRQRALKRQPANINRSCLDAINPKLFIFQMSINYLGEQPVPLSHGGLRGSPYILKINVKKKIKDLDLPKK